MIIFLILSTLFAADTNIIVGEVDWYDLKKEPRSIGRVVVPRFGFRCMGWFLDRDKIITNNHCVPFKSAARKVYITIKGEKIICDKFLKTNSRLDYTILRCKKNRTPLEYSSNFSGKIFVIHKQCDYENNKWCKKRWLVSPGTITELRKYEFKHSADTLAGSSGAPVLDEFGNVIGLHKAGYGGDHLQRGKYNLATRLDVILKDYYRTE